MTAPLPVPELVRRWDALVLADVALDHLPTRAAREAGSVLRAPATPEQVEATEARLGRRLPPSYREFLLCSDGAYADLHGVSTVLADDPGEVVPHDSAVVGIGFLPCAEVRWLRDASPRTAEIYAETAGEDGLGRALVEGADVWPWAPFAEGLVIGTDHAPGLTCLVPFDDAEEWEVWEIAKETSAGFRSFRSMLEHEVARRTPVTTVAELHDVLARRAAGDVAAQHRVARTTAPDAVPVLADLVASGRFPHAEVMALGRIGTDEAVDALVRLRPRWFEHALLLAGTPRARDVLADGGHMHELSLLGDPRAVDLAQAALVDGTPGTGAHDAATAVAVLARSGDPRFVDLLLGLDVTDPWTRLAVARALARLGSPAGRERLAGLAADDGPAQGAARYYLRRVDEGV